MAKKIMFRMAARCEAAGRPNNEDNYQVDNNLADDQWGFTADENVSLGDKGALLVVCDGMGGMNAGEVASAIAVKTIKDYFCSSLLTPEVLASPTKHIHKAIVAADAAIKEHEKSHPETEGMGSTVVMAWLLNQKVYVGWCGDSRCYRYNPQIGLVRLSHDHSYVQELVDAGKLSEELAFDHPNNNIITRSLGDPRGEAQPDVKEYDLYNEDIILLCSDGLCGCLRDAQIAEQIQQHQTSMQECRDALWKADEAAGWTDNVTIALAQILEGAGVASRENAPAPDALSDSKAKLLQSNKRLKIALIIVAVIVLLGIGFGVRKFVLPNCPLCGDKTDSLNMTTELPVEKITETPADVPTPVVTEPATENKRPVTEDKHPTSKTVESSVRDQVKEAFEQVEKPKEKEPLPDVELVPKVEVKTNQSAEIEESTKAEPAEEAAPVEKTPAAPVEVIEANPVKKADTVSTAVAAPEPVKPEE